MPVLLLIRHAENDFVRSGRLAGRQRGVHLNAQGQAQAVALARALALAGYPIQAVYSSPLERAQETAQPLAAALGLPVQVQPGLQEIDLGAWTHRTLKSLRRLKAWRQVQEHPARFAFPEGESFLAAQHRIVRTLEELAAAHPPEAWLACVGHADPIRLALAFYLGLPLDLFQRLVVAPASVSAVHLPPEGPPRVLCVNHTVDRLPFPPPRPKEDAS